jgi:hypothetical protein
MDLKIIPDIVVGRLPIYLLGQDGGKDAADEPPYIAQLGSGQAPSATQVVGLSTR